MTELPDGVRALVDGANYAHVATVMPDGSPHSVPIWVGLERDRVAFMASPRSRKARNLAREPRLALSITDRDDPFAMAAIRGRVSERIEGAAAWEIVDRISNKYVGQPYPRDQERVVFLVEAEHAWARKY
jgi:PPOX class probable F420-dependent enzyme